jgi:hypothetical protein
MINQTAKTGTPHLRGGVGCDPSVVAMDAARLVWTAPVLQSRGGGPCGGSTATLRSDGTFVGGSYKGGAS